jgi:hypothetical protein
MYFSKKKAENLEGFPTIKAWKAPTYKKSLEGFLRE